MTFDVTPTSFDIDPAADAAPALEPAHARAWKRFDSEEIDGTLCDVPMGDAAERAGLVFAGR
jgi:hypothetical protein